MLLKDDSEAQDRIQQCVLDQYGHFLEDEQLALLLRQMGYRESELAERALYRHVGDDRPGRDNRPVGHNAPEIADINKHYKDLEEEIRRKKTNEEFRDKYQNAPKSKAEKVKEYSAEINKRMKEGQEKSREIWNYVRSRHRPAFFGKRDRNLAKVVNRFILKSEDKFNLNELDVAIREYREGKKEDTPT